MRNICILFVVIAAAVIATQQARLPRQSLTFRLGTWWLTDTSGNQIVETAYLARLRRQLRITSIDYRLPRYNRERSITYVDFANEVLAIYTVVTLPSDSPAANPPQETEEKPLNSLDSEPQLSIFDKRPTCFVANLTYTMREASQEIGRRVWSNQILEGTPQYFTTNWTIPLTLSEINSKSSKLAGFCGTAVLSGRVYELSDSTNAQTTTLTVSGQIDPTQNGKSVPWEIEIQDLS